METPKKIKIMESKTQDKGWLNLEVEEGDNKFFQFLPQKGLLGKLNNTIFDALHTGKNQFEINAKSEQNQDEINTKSGQNQDEFRFLSEENQLLRKAYEILNKNFKVLAEQIYEHNPSKAEYLRGLSNELIHYESNRKWFLFVIQLYDLQLMLEKQKRALSNGLKSPDTMTDNEYLTKYENVAKKLKVVSKIKELTKGETGKYWKIKSISNDMIAYCGASYIVVKRCIDAMTLQRTKNMKNTKRLLSVAAVVFVCLLVGFQFWKPTITPTNTGTQTAATTTATGTTTTKFHVVAATFTSKENALKSANFYKRKFKHTSILNDGVKYRVSVYCSINQDSAMLINKTVNGIIKQL